MIREYLLSNLANSRENLERYSLANMNRLLADPQYVHLKDSQKQKIQKNLNLDEFHCYFEAESDNYSFYPFPRAEKSPLSKAKHHQAFEIFSHNLRIPSWKDSSSETLHTARAEGALLPCFLGHFLPSDRTLPHRPTSITALRFQDQLPKNKKKSDPNH